MLKSGGPAVTLPFHLVNPGKANGHFAESSLIIFQPDGSHTVDFENFTFQNGTIHVARSPTSLLDSTSSSILQKQVPFFSISAVVLVILFRNLFFSAFKKYFLSLSSNYEIDFNIQKIGVFPILLSVAIILLTFSDLNERVASFPNHNWTVLLARLKSGVQFFVIPIAFSVLGFFALNLTTRLFPLVFSDIKTLFALCFVTLIWNFANFGSSIQNYFSFQNFVGLIGSMYFIIRTLLLFNVLRRAYRFHVPITLFYICVFNLGTVLILVKGFDLDIFSFYE